jgi:hypothetical protein
LVVSANVVLFWFLCQLPGLGCEEVSIKSGNRVHWRMSTLLLWSCSKKPLVREDIDLADCVE